MEIRKYDVFISYSRKDKIIVDKICEAFEKNGISYFRDTCNIGAGYEFPAVLSEAILSSQLFLFVASKNSYEAKFTQSEIIFAFNNKEKNDLIPYIVDDSSLPRELEFTFAAVNWIRREKSIDDRLVNEILKRKNEPVLSPIPPTPPSPFIIIGELWSRYKKYIVFFSILLIVSFLLLIGRIVPPPPPPPLYLVSDSMCHNPILGSYSYTGPIDENNQPHGKGTAKFENGDLYEGEFEHGTFEGDAKYTFAIGDRFTGQFKANNMYEGTYALENGEYFQGRFRDGTPDSGKWYNEQGYVISD